MREHRVETRACRCCGATTQASFPAAVKVPVQYAVGVRSRAVYLNLYQLFRVARTGETRRDLFGCPLSQATVARAGRFCSGKLVRCEQRIKAGSRDSAVIGADETGLTVAGEGGRVHVARTEELTHFAFAERRGKAAIDESGILPQFRGKLVSDGYRAYCWYEQCQHGLCNSHRLRELHYLEETSPEQKVWIEPLRKLLLATQEAALTARDAGEKQWST